MSLEGDVCPAECAAGPVGWLLAFPCPVPDGEMVLPAFPWSLELGQRSQERRFIKGLLEMQINTVTNVVTLSCASSSNSYRASLSSSLPAGGQEHRLKTRVHVSMSAPDPGSRSSTERAMRKENRFFYELKLKVWSKLIDVRGFGAMF